MKSKTRIVWPYIIGFSILTFFGAIVFSITLIVSEAPVQKSNHYMMGYNHADLQANEIIQAKINFNKKYKISYITDDLSQENTVIKYKLTDLENNPVNDAKIKVVITRPVNNANNQELKSPTVSNGIYTFDSVTLAQPGRWNIMAKVTVGDFQRFYNVKADTRAKEAFEY